MSIDLYAYQHLAVDRMRSGTLLCGGVGTGKSRTALAFYFTKICEGQIEPDYGKPKETVPLYIITTARKRDTKEWDEECAVFLISQNVKESVCGIECTIDSWNNIKKYESVQNAFFIFDEQRVVGYGAWSKAFIKIAKKNRWILLTATPGDTWMDYIPVFIANGFYKNKTDFIRKHVIYNRYTKYPKVDKYINCGTLIRHRKEIMVTMVGNKKAVRHSKMVHVDYNQAEYDIVAKKRWNIVEQRPIQNISECCYLMRRVTNGSCNRISAVRGINRDHPKMIVFYNFDYELELLRAFLWDKELSEWNGHKHEPLPKSDNWIYLVQYTAGAEGWNCTTTDTIVFYSQNYSYKTMQQAAGRIDRLNTPYSDLYYYHLVSDAPIDKAITRTLKKKKSFNEKTFMGDSWQKLPK